MRKTKLNLRIKILSKLVTKIIYDEILLELEFFFLKSIEISDFDYIFIRPGNDHYLRQFIKKFRKKGFKGKVIGISQAIPALSNIVHNKNDYEHPKEEMYFNKKYSLVHDCDNIVINSQTTLGQYKKIGISFENKISIISSLRNTAEWQNTVRLDFIKKFNFTKQKSAKLNMLFIHSNFMSNINQEEVRRAVRIAKMSKNFEIGIRPHVRLGKVQNNREIKYIFKGINKYEVFRESLTEAIMWSDVCIFYGSSGCIDALSFGKHTVFLRHATSNILDSKLKNHITECECPHDFIRLCNKKNLDNNLNQKYPLESAGELIKVWDNYLS